MTSDGQGRVEAVEHQLTKQQDNLWVKMNSKCLRFEICPPLFSISVFFTLVRTRTCTVWTRINLIRGRDRGEDRDKQAPCYKTRSAPRHSPTLKQLIPISPFIVLVDLTNIQDVQPSPHYQPRYPRGGL